MDDQFDCFVISLENKPQRRAAFLESAKAAGLACQIFNAIDGTALDASEAARVLAPGAINYTPGAIGTAMSHLALWRRCADLNKPHIVFEDDVVLRRDLKVQLAAALRGAEWDIVLLGYNFDGAFELNFAPGIDFGGTFSVPYPTPQQLADFSSSSNFVGLQRVMLAFGTCGYALLPQGARLLMQSCFPMDNRLVHARSFRQIIRSHGIDCIMASLYPSMKAFACVAPLVMASNEKQASSTHSDATSASRPSPAPQYVVRYGNQTPIR